MLGVLKRIFDDESMFVKEYSTSTEGELVLTQALPGDIECLELKGNTLYLQLGAFIACESGVKLGMGWVGLRMFVAREGLFRLKVSGNGRVWFGAYGGIFQREIEDEYIVDSGHLVAYEPSIGMQIGMTSGVFSSLFGDEGLVCRFSGQGKV